MDWVARMLAAAYVRQFSPKAHLAVEAMTYAGMRSLLRAVHVPHELLASRGLTEAKAEGDLL